MNTIRDVYAVRHEVSFRTQRTHRVWYTYQLSLQLNRENRNLLRKEHSKVIVKAYR